MTMIEVPPRVDVIDAKASAPLDAMALKRLQQLQDEYAYWSEVKYKKVDGFESPLQLWATIKAQRAIGAVSVGDPFGFHFCLTNYMSRVCHHFDMQFGGRWESEFVLPRENRQRYLISSIIDEAISSSQMEGASTTRKIAKEMLRKNLAPKDKSQRMIYNNYQTICYLSTVKEAPLDEELILRIHALMTDGTMDNAADCGRWRLNNDVVVANAVTNEVVHTPPDYNEIPRAIRWLCDFVNAEGAVFIHPVIKAVTLHFFMSYLHPFVDGNGRTARALFHWYLLKEGYWLTEYLSISRAIYKSKAAYEKAFLKAEADTNDIGYFITYHLRVLEQAFDELKKYISRKVAQQSDHHRLLRLGGITPRQAEIVYMLLKNDDEIITVKDVAARLLVTPTTAKHDILGLVERGFLAELSLNRQKKGYYRGPHYDEVLALLG